MTDVYEKSRGEGPLKILYVGSITRQKGLDVLVHSLRALPRKECRLTVTGRQDMDPGFVAKIYRLIDSLGLDGQINIIPPVTGNDISRFYQDHHVLVLPSVNEAYGIVYLEAQKNGLPVIGTSAGGAGEIIRHGENGYLIRPGDSETLAELLLGLQRNRALLSRLGKNALAAYGVHPVWDDTGRIIRRLLLDLAGRPGNNR